MTTQLRCAEILETALDARLLISDEGASKPSPAGAHDIFQEGSGIEL